MTTKKSQHSFGNGNYYIKIKTMKTFITILLMILLFACSSNKQLQFNTSDCNFNDKISENEKIINIELYKNQLEKDGYFKIFENDSISDGIDLEFDRRIYNKKTNIEKRINYNQQTLKAKNSICYYTKGNFFIGNKYFYNEQGQIIKTIDHNQYRKYPICYKEIIRSTIKKAGIKFYFQGLDRDSIIENNQKTYYWKVYFEDSISKPPTLIHKFFKINAKTGKTITEQIVN